jgi:hypothetical protein
MSWKPEEKHGKKMDFTLPRNPDQNSRMKEQCKPLRRMFSGAGSF